MEHKGAHCCTREHKVHMMRIRLRPLTISSSLLCLSRSHIVGQRGRVSLISHSHSLCRLLLRMGDISYCRISMLISYCRISMLIPHRGCKFHVRLPGESVPNFSLAGCLLVQGRGLAACGRAWACAGCWGWLLLPAAAFRRTVMLLLAPMLESACIALAGGSKISIRPDKLAFR